MTEAERLDRMIEIASETGMPLDHIVAHMARCDQTKFREFSVNPSRLPKYIKSSVNP